MRVPLNNVHHWFDLITQENSHSFQTDFGIFEFQSTLQSSICFYIYIEMKVTIFYEN